MAQASLVRELWAFIKAPEEVVAAAHHHRDAAGRGLLLFAQGSALAPFIYTIF